MYKVVDVKDNLFGIIDTSDNVVEYYTKTDLIKILESIKDIKIAGLDKYNIKIKSDIIESDSIFKNFIQWVETNVLCINDTDMWSSGVLTIYVYKDRSDGQVKVTPIERLNNLCKLKVKQKGNWKVTVRKPEVGVDAGAFIFTPIVVEIRGKTYILYGVVEPDGTVRDNSDKDWVKPIIDNLDAIKSCMLNAGNIVRKDAQDRKDNINRYQSSISSLYGQLENYFRPIRTSLYGYTGSLKLQSIDKYSIYLDKSKIRIEFDKYIMGNSLNFCITSNKVYLDRGGYELLIEHDNRLSKRPYYFDENNYSASNGADGSTVCGIYNYAEEYYLNDNYVIGSPDEILNYLQQYVEWFNRNSVELNNWLSKMINEQ